MRTVTALIGLRSTIRLQRTLWLDGWHLTDDDDDLQRWRIPDVSIPPDDYLLIFASGKDRSDPGGELHTNFKLSAEGEYLALIEPDGTTVSTEFAPEYPPQLSDVSYGSCDGGSCYFVTPTPQAANGEGSTGLAADVQFDKKRGFYDLPFTLGLTTTTDDATIRYTLDGSEPTETVGQVYGGPIAIATTTCVRAAAFADEHLPSQMVTHTYIFLDDVLDQPSDPVGFPV